MNRGPQTGKARNGANDLNYTEKAIKAWGDVPDWVAELAAFADQNGAKPAGVAIGYSNSVVSLIINRAPGLVNFDIARIEQAVRGGLMGLTVACPEMGEMSRRTCLDWQKKPKAATSGFRMRMYRACRNNCPHARLKGASNGTE